MSVNIKFEKIQPNQKNPLTAARMFSILGLQIKVEGGWNWPG
jgi:hypothetical protein